MESGLGLSARSPAHMHASLEEQHARPLAGQISRCRESRKSASYHDHISFPFHAFHEFAPGHTSITSEQVKM
jgi:hypothetical protein